jgi:hypothetical protein
VIDTVIDDGFTVRSRYAATGCLALIGLRRPMFAPDLVSIFLALPRNDGYAADDHSDPHASHERTHRDQMPRLRDQRNQIGISPMSEFSKPSHLPSLQTPHPKAAGR